MEQWQILFAVFSICTALILFAALWDRKTHWRMRFAASRRLKALQRLPDDRTKFLYLKKTHHFVFEEMILTAFKKRGYQIERNTAYTGDGGIDGRVYFQGKLFLIQAKRYWNHIDPRHISEFAEVCRQHNAKGLFIHTGKTGGRSWAVARRERIDMVSGQRLLKLFQLRT